MASVIIVKISLDRTHTSSPVASCYTNESVYSIIERRTNIIRVLRTFNVTSLDDSSSKSDSHGMSNHIYLWSLSIFENSLQKFAIVHHKLLAVNMLKLMRDISKAPLSGIDISFCVSSGKEVLDWVPKSIIHVVKANSHVGVSMDKYNWSPTPILVLKFIWISATEGSSWGIRPVEVIRLVSPSIIKPTYKMVSQTSGVRRHRVVPFAKNICSYLKDGNYPYRY